MSAKLAKRLHEPDHWTCPHGVRARPEPFLTYGPEVAEINAAAGFAPDAQQELGLDLIFAIRPDGTPASFEFCVICQRQALKTGLLKQAAIGYLYVTEQRLVVWSAHELGTSSEAQREIADLLTTHPSLSRHLMPGPNNGIYDANGQERIELATGARILFRARTRDGGRGLAAPRLILDEAFALKASMLGSLLPLLVAQPDAQVLYASSAGKEDSDALFELRDRGRSGSTADQLSYLEWHSPREDCATPDCRHPKDALERGLDCALDREHLLARNPGVSSGRVTIERLRQLRQSMPVEEYTREILGWWPEPLKLTKVIDTQLWNAQKGAGPADGTKPGAFGVDAAGDRVFSIVAAWDLGEERSHVEEVYGNTTDSLAVLDWLTDRADRRTPILMNATSVAGTLAALLKQRHRNVRLTGPADMGKACGLFYGDITSRRLTHADQPRVNQSIEVAKKRALGGTSAGDGVWVWDLRTEPGAPSPAPTVAMTLARYGLTSAPGAGRGGRGASTHRRTTSSSRKGVVL